MRRERNLKEIISVLTEYAKEGKDELEYEYLDEEKLTRVLEIIEKLDKKELEKLQDEELRSRCREIYEDSKKAKQALEAGELSEVHNYLERIIKLEKYIYEEFDAGDLSEKISKGQLLGKGNNGKVYEIEYDPDLVLKIFDSENPDDKLHKVKKYKNLEDQLLEKFGDVDIAEINEVGYFEGSAAAVMKRAPGQEVHIYGEEYKRWSKMNEILAEADVSQFRKVAKDIERIRNYFDIFIDPNCENFFYHPEKGFTIIDLGKEIFAGERYSQFPDLLSPFTEYGAAANPRHYADKVTRKDYENMKKIAKKMEVAEIPVPNKTEEAFNSRMEEIQSKL
jgi:hypothetical protein